SRDWSSDVCSSDLQSRVSAPRAGARLWTRYVPPSSRTAIRAPWCGPRTPNNILESLKRFSILLTQDTRTASQLRKRRTRKQGAFESGARPIHCNTFKTVVSEHRAVWASVVDCKWNTNSIDFAVIVWRHLKNVRTLRTHDAEFDDVAVVAIDVQNLAVAAGPGGL